MFHRFASVLFGDEVEEVSRCGPGGERSFGQKEEEEEDEDWILVDYLAESCSSPCGDGRAGTPPGPGNDDEEEDLVMIPSPMASPPIRYASCSSLNSTAETDPDGGPEEEEDEEEEDEGFLRLEACSMEESWFVTPPPCFTGRSSKPILLETSPLENLLIEHPSMSVYAHHSPPRLALSNLPRSLNLDLLPANPSAPPACAGGKEMGRRALDSSHHRSELTPAPRRTSLHPACYAAALSTHAGLLHQVQQQSGRLSQRTQPLSRNALRRINLLHQPGTKQTKSANMFLHQPSHRHLNF